MKNFKAKNAQISSRHYRVEVLLYNFVTEDMEKMLRPLNLIHNILLNPKYCIKDNFITPNKPVSSLISVCAALLIIALFMYRNYLAYFDDTVAQYAGSLRILICVFECIFYFVGFMMNTIVASYHQNSNIDFVLTVQEVHNMFSVNDDFRKFIYGNWICVILLILAYIVFFIISYFNYEYDYIYDSCCVVFLISFDVNVINAIRLMKFLKTKLNVWHTAFLDAGETVDVHLHSTLFQAYVKIMKCYKILESTFMLLILYHIIEAFIHSLLYVKMFLDFFTYAEDIDDCKCVGRIAIITYWLSKNIILQIILPLQCESFYDAVKEIQETCGYILRSNYSGEEKRFCKNIQRFHRATFTKMTVCGLFYIDAKLPLKLVVFFTQYLIVLLQFAFL